MNKTISTAGIVLIIVSGFLFLITYSGGALGNSVITGSDPTLNFAAFLFVIIFLPIGSGLAFFGMAYRPPVLVAGTQAVYRGSSGVAKGALALAVIAIIIGAGALVYAGATLASQNDKLNSINNSVSTLSSKPSAASINRAPGVVAYRVDWSNTDPTGQDRFNPETIVVVQGDIVQLLFEHNDTDAHTFTMYTATTAYGFQINLSYTGMRNFLTNLNFSAPCVNGTYNQDTSGLTSNGVSTTYCVSGTSLLSPDFLASHAATKFKIAANPNPASPFTPTNQSGNPGPVLLNVSNTAIFSVANTQQALQFGNNTAEAYGIGAFQATTPGVFEYFCDYHVSNGMFGYLVVLPNAYCVAHGSDCGVTNSTS